MLWGMIDVAQCRTTSSPEFIQRSYLIELLQKNRNIVDKLRQLGRKCKNVVLTISGVLWQSPLFFATMAFSIVPIPLTVAGVIKSLFSSWCERWSFILDKNVMFYSIYHLGKGVNSVLPCTETKTETKQVKQKLCSNLQLLRYPTIRKIINERKPSFHQMYQDLVILIHYHHCFTSRAI